MPKKKIELEAPIEDELIEEITGGFDVIANDGGVLRTYSIEIHGKDAEKLAHQYAKKIGASVR